MQNSSLSRFRTIARIRVRWLEPSPCPRSGPASANCAQAWIFTPFPKQLLESLERDYSKDRSFREAFAAWISRLFSDYGLIVFDPLMEGYQHSLSRFYEIAVTRRQPIIEALVERNQAIVEAGYDPQVWVDDHESLLFLVDGSRRYKLLWEEGR